MTLPIVVLVAAIGFGCGGKSAASAPPPPGGEPTTETFASQVERGAALYAESCASCHGDAGQGQGSAPAVVGQGALPLDPPAGAKHRDVQFRTALDVFLWVKKTMPADDPGSLTDAQYVDILAFDLKANGVSLDKPLDAAVARDLALR